MGKLGLNSGYIGSDQRTTTNGVVGYDKFYLERANGRFEPVLEGDSDARAFLERVIAAGGTLSTTEQLAVTQLVIQMKLNGIWDKMKAIYPMVGASAAACAQNLKSSSFTGTFSGGWTFTSNGVKGNGVSGTMDTGLNTSTQLNINSAHVSYYSNDDYNITNPLLSNNNFDCFIQQQSNIYYTMLGRNGFIQTANTTIKAFYLTTRQLSVELKQTLNGSVIGPTDTVSSTSFSNQNIFLNRYQGTYTDSRCAFCSIGDGLSDSESLSCYNAVQAFNTTLSRQV